MDHDTRVLAEAQHGLLGTWQLRERGWSRSAVRWALARGTLVPVRPRVVAVGVRRRATEAEFLAAVLDLGPDAVLSHGSAAALWDLMPGPRAIHVTVRKQRRAAHDVVAHRSAVSGADRTVRAGVPVTALPRTLVDLADVLEPARLAEAVEKVPHLDVRTMSRCLERHHGRRATGVLARLLDAYDPRTRSPLEDAFLALCRAHGVPAPRVNVGVAGAERDFSWPEARLVIEVDGGAFHAGRRARNADSRRDVDLGIAGWRVHRLTYERVVLDPAGAAEAVLALLAAYP